MKRNVPIQAIHIIHQSHLDLGYTDPASTCRALHVRYIRAALGHAESTARYPVDARFRWTCEAFEPVSQFMEEASADERRRFRRAVRAGQIEVTAMPFNITPLLDAEGWAALMRRARPLFEAFRPRVAMQNDINGLPWGLLPRLRRAGVRWIWMGMNGFAGRSPARKPGVFLWEGAHGERLPVWVGLPYGNGYGWFNHRKRASGPVPPAHDIWAHPSLPGEVWDASPAGLAAARELLDAKLAAFEWDLNVPVLALQTTGIWRWDNDPPCPMISDFVRAWNRGGHPVRLHLSTPSRFLAALRPFLPKRLPVLRGDWSDWWADGVASTPVELALNRKAKRILADAPRAARLLRSRRAGVAADADQAWQRAAMFDEHTWGAYESVAAPYSARALSCASQKMELAHRAHEDALGLQAEIIRQCAAYCPASQATRLVVLNPGAGQRSGWVRVSMRGMSAELTGLRDAQTGACVALEDVPEPAWVALDRKVARQLYEWPGNVWGFAGGAKRFRLSRLAAGARRVFEFVKMPTDPPPSFVAPAVGRQGDWAWRWDTRNGRLCNLRHRRAGVLFDARAASGPGDLVVERGTGFGARNDLMARNGKPNIIWETPRLVRWQALPSADAARFFRLWRHPAFHRAEQVWDFFADGAIELTTTLWIKEDGAPQSWFLAFPFRLPGVPAWEAMGTRVRAGHDQIPSSCGELVCVGDLMRVVGARHAVNLWTPDTPLGCFGPLRERFGRGASVPDNRHFHACLHTNYWTTNFAITKAGKLTVRHVLRVTDSGDLPDAGEVGELWGFPSRKG